AATYGTGDYIPATSSYAGYQAYQPVTAPAGRSYVDQSKNEYHISLTGGTAPGTQLDRQLQDALEKYERGDAYQFLGVGEENMTLAGVLYPELTGGKLTMTTLRLMADEGRAWPLLDGTGMIYGMYVISKVSETGSI
ncbi:phage tail protein, partial [Escherichia coli]|uniref:phage tail protein n=1 Tax=Escherichia coli TaxID=562 RepID=UPI000AA14590